jgi:acyl-CoA hydrolase
MSHPFEGLAPNYSQSISEKIDRSITHVVKAIFPDSTNHYDTLFGGEALKMMDEIAFITATRFCRLKVVTVSTDRIDFKKPIPAGSIIELIGQVSKIGKTSIEVMVEVYKEDMYSHERELALKGRFTFVAIDDNKKPIPILI